MEGDRILFYYEQCYQTDLQDLISLKEETAFQTRTGVSLLRLDLDLLG